MSQYMEIIFVEAFWIRKNINLKYIFFARNTWIYTSSSISMSRISRRQIAIPWYSLFLLLQMFKSHSPCHPFNLTQNLAPVSHPSANLRKFTCEHHLSSFQIASCISMSNLRWYMLSISLFSKTYLNCNISCSFQVGLEPSAVMVRQNLSL